MNRITRKEALEISKGILIRAEKERLEHNTNSPDCWCGHEIEEVDGNLIVIHRDKSEAN